MRNRLLSLALLFLIATSCQQTPKKAAVPPSEDIPSTGAAATPVAASLPSLKIKSGDRTSSETLTAKPLTAAGINTQARFSKDGSRLLFISQHRLTHKQAQVYELHLELMKEKRITFHDGDNSSPVYTPDGKSFAFASETDELKEEPLVSRRLIKIYYPEGLRAQADETQDEEANPFSEVYRQTLHGRSIERLTRSPGFDGDPDIDPKKQRIVFSSSRSGRGTRLYLLEGKATRALTTGQVIDRGARFSPDGRYLVWTRSTAKEPMARLMIASGDFSKPQPLLKIENGRALHPDWHPAGTWILFASNHDGGHFNLYVADRSGSCVHPLTNADFDLLYPSFSPDGKQIVFSSEYEGRAQIYIMDFRPPPDCPKAQPPKAS